MRHAWMLPFVVLLIVSLACAIPGVQLPQVKLPNVQLPGQASPTPSAAEEQALPTTAATEAVGAVATTTQPALGVTGQTAVTPTVESNLPPVLAEAQPAPGSQIPAKGSLTFYFTEVMDRESVQRSMEIKPVTQGSFEWVDDATVRFTPAQPLPASTAVDIVFNNNVRSKSGKFLTKPVELNYRTVDPTQLTEQLPPADATGVNSAAAVVASFSQPVVPLVGEVTNLPPGFTLDPQANGRGEWLNTHTYIFYPQPALRGGVKYTVHVNRDLTGVNDRDWSFTTSSPQVVSVAPGNQQMALLDTPVSIKFNQPMDKASVESNFTLMNSVGYVVKGAFQWNRDGTEVDFQPGERLNRDSRYTVAISTNATGLGGTPLGSALSAAFTTVPTLSVAATQPSGDEPLQVFENSFGSIAVTFTAPQAKGQNYSDLIRFFPDVADFNAYLSEDGTTLNVSGFFQPATEYRLVISASLKDRWNQPMDNPWEMTFETSNAAPSFNIPILQTGTNILFVTTKDKSLPARVTNLSTLHLTSGNLSLGDFLSLAADPHAKFSPQQKETWQQTLDLPDNQSQSVEVSLNSSGSAPTPGLYYYLITSPELTAQTIVEPAPFLVVASDVQLVLKRSATRLFVWAVNLKDNTSAAGLPVTIYDGKGNALGSGTTDTTGIVQVDLPPNLDPFAPLEAVTGKPGEVDFSLGTTEWTQGVTGWEFGLRQDISDNKPMAYLYTDRPIYRPGQIVDFRAVTRLEKNGRYQLLDQGQLTMKATGVSDIGQPIVLSTQTLTVSAYGTVHGSFVIPGDASPGIYTLSIAEIPDATLTFQVANYRKPQIDLQATFAVPEALNGQDQTATVNAHYYFGAPAGQLPVSWNVYSRPATFDLPDGYQAGKLDTSWLNPLSAPTGNLGGLVAQGQGQTAADGSLTINLPAGTIQSTVDPQSEAQLVLEVTGQDESGQPVSVRTTMTLHPAKFFVGIRPDRWTGQAKAEMSFDVQAVDWQRNLSGGHRLTAEFQKVNWTQEGPADILSGVPRFQEQVTPVGSTDFEVDATGRARLAFTPPDPGTYRLDVHGEGAVTQVLVWVGGEGAAPWPALPNQHLRLTTDANAYKPGQTARLFIPNPYPDGGLALISVERAQVMREEVIEVNGSSLAFDLPIADEDAPNIYVSVVLLGKQDDGRPDFRQGYLEIPVDPANETLQVRVLAQPDHAQPGGETTLTLQVADEQGQPVEGEFSAALIDKAVLALTDPNAPDINQAFYGQQPLGIQNSLSMAAYSWRIPLNVPGRGGGGGGFPETEIRQNFQDTAYWNATIKTDASGLARVAVKLPDNLTTWVVDVRGVTVDTRTGQARIEVVTSKELLVQPVTPRFFVTGDHVQLAAVVQNNSAAALTVDATLQQSGFNLDDAGKATQRVNIPAGGRQRVNWWGTVQDVDAVDLAFSAQAGNLQDSARPEAGKLPVLRYNSPQTFGTSGVLAEAGQRQELVGLPRSFSPTGGGLQLEFSPSLASTVISGLQALQAYPYDFPEATISRLLPNLEAYQALQGLGVNSPTLKAQLDTVIRDGIQRLVKGQNSDGGWGWSDGGKSDSYISAYTLLGLSRATGAGVDVPDKTIADAQQFLANNIKVPARPADWQLDRLVFQSYVLQQSGKAVDVETWFARVDRLAPWSKALLALMLQNVNSMDARIKTLETGLQESAVRSASGANWEDTGDREENLASASFVTAVVTYALARIDPASPLLIDAVRYLTMNRQPDGAWASTYESAWALMALTEALKGTGDLQAQYTFSAQLNGRPLAIGQAGGGDLTPVTATAPLSDLKGGSASSLVISREQGPGRLYYRAYLQVDRPVDSAPAVDQGISVDRVYLPAGQDCSKQNCQPVTSIKMATPSPLLQVRLTINLPHDAAHVVVEDHIPAGTEILDLGLKTSQQGAALPVVYDPRDPLAQGWGWWLFNAPQISDDKIRWVADSLPAGTYQLTYQLIVEQPGEYRLIPARAYEYYFPEVGGNSAGSVLTVAP